MSWAGYVPTASQGAQAASTGAAGGPSAWIAIAIIIGGLGAVAYGIVAAFQAGGRAKEAGAIGDRILERYGQKDQSAALRTCVRLAVRGQDCEGGSLDGNGVLPRRGSRAERCGYSESKCMSSADLQAFSQCMRGDDL